VDVAPPKPPLSDGTVALRLWSRGDAAELVAALDGDDEITVWLDSIPQPYTDADAHAWLAQTGRSWSEGAGCPFAVVDAATGRLLGGIGLRWNDRVNLIGEVGYWARADARGQGVTTRALRLLADWALGPAGCERLVLRADTQNMPSLRVAERAGFVQEGVERSARFSPRQGRRVDFVVYSRLPSDSD
jgi:RimJ/RimL family protein N-acetyltransferase